MVQSILVEANLFIAIKLQSDLFIRAILYVASILRREKYKVEIESKKFYCKRDTVIEIDAFSGNLIEFPAWEIAFDALIDQQVSFVELKPNLLSHHLSGEAKSLVLGLLFNQTKQAYEATLARLKERFGNPSMLNHAFLDKLGSWPQVKANQLKELQRFSDFFTQICAVRKAAPDSLKNLDFPSESMKILSKLPMHFEIE